MSINSPESASPLATSSKQAITQLLMREDPSASGRRSKNFWRRGSARTATSWLGSSIFSRFLTKASALSISSRVTELYRLVRLLVLSEREDENGVASLLERARCGRLGPRLSSPSAAGPEHG